MTLIMFLMSLGSMSILRNVHVAVSNLVFKGHDKGPSYIIIRRMDYRG